LRKSVYPRLSFPTCEGRSVRRTWGPPGLRLRASEGAKVRPPEGGTELPFLTRGLLATLRPPRSHPAWPRGRVGGGAGLEPGTSPARSSEPGSVPVRPPVVQASPVRWRSGQRELTTTLGPWEGPVEGVGHRRDSVAVGGHGGRTCVQSRGRLVTLILLNRLWVILSKRLRLITLGGERESERERERARGSQEAEGQKPRPWRRFPAMVKPKALPRPCGGHVHGRPARPSSLPWGLGEPWGRRPPPL
jgi:hypothetical protein